MRPDRCLFYVTLAPIVPLWFDLVAGRCCVPDVLLKWRGTNVSCGTFFHFHYPMCKGNDCSRYAIIKHSFRLVAPNVVWWTTEI
jgi:hypothetical protein